MSPGYLRAQQHFNSQTILLLANMHAVTKRKYG